MQPPLGLAPLWTSCVMSSTDQAHELLGWREISGQPLEECARHKIAYLPGGWYTQPPLCCLFKWEDDGLSRTSFSSSQFICHLTFVHVLNAGPSGRLVMPSWFQLSVWPLCPYWSAFTHFVNIYVARANMNGRTLNWYATPLNTNLGKRLWWGANLM